MGSFAGLLRSAGYSVRGSDENVYPPMSDALAAWGIEVMKGYKPENLDSRPDLVVIGNVIRRTNVEAQAAVERGLSYTSFPKALGDLFLEKQEGVVVAGTHGKTTTTSLTAWLLMSAGRDPSLLVGGIPSNFGQGFRLGAGKHFVVEGDEYDTAYFDKVPKFLHYKPKTLIATSIEYDHADIYASVEAIEREFDKLFSLVPETGRIYACATWPRVLARRGSARAPVETYTARAGIEADWTVEDLGQGPGGLEMTVLERGHRRGHFFLPMSGVHNAENALAAIAFAFGAGLTQEEIRMGLRAFQGVARRQTVRSEIDGVRIIDDFAHHPTAVRETIAAVRSRYPSGRLFAIFEPRSATSARAHFQTEYATAFDGADHVIIAGVGRSEIKDGERLDIAKLSADVRARGIEADSIASVDDIVVALAKDARSGDTLLFMSNGGFGGIYGKMEGALSARVAARS
ncbi:MAG: UDP-N-acetylmuramate dehydrogenase [Deltaproteobacteria bacterium]|nr:UDP-N-acetylmuramate dehydrogenase [Deltaproteobacteria bacterium]